MSRLKNAPAAPDAVRNLATDRSSTQKAYQSLRRLIIQGELKPGEKVKIARLCKLLVTGESPVREALSLLASGQLVQRVDQRGCRASPISLENFEEILQLRCTDEHLCVMDTAISGDMDLCSERLLEHYRKTCSYLIELFDANQLVAS